MVTSYRHLAILAAIVLVGWAMSALVQHYPGSIPLWLPYEFSWTVYLSSSLSVAWYLRGLRSTEATRRPSVWRQAAFLIGVAVIYGAMHTYYDYAAQHMFFIHRIQHLLLHHWGPFLIALSDPSDTLTRGVPRMLREAVRFRWVEATLSALQQPFLAAFLFVALIYLWPAPYIHFFAMLDPTLYTIMNWSVTVDGLLFWALVLDPRPQPLARLGYGTRFLMCIGVMFPQIVIGAAVTFAERDLFDVYAICGRIISMTAMDDQRIGGLILWIPGAMTSVLGALVVLNFLRLDEEAPRAAASDGEPAYE